MKKRWYAGTFRPSGWWRWLPVYVSPMMWAPGIAIGSFGHVAYVVWI